MADIRSKPLLGGITSGRSMSARYWPLAAFLLFALLLTGTCHMQDWRAATGPVSSDATPADRLIPEPDYESKAEMIAPGVQFTLPVKRSSAMKFTAVPPIAGDPKAALDTMLRAATCEAPVIVQWQKQWRGDCMTPDNQRVRIALVNGRAGWAGLRIDYSDAANLRLAPIAKMILDSGTLAP